ncbi:hypothetical protein [Propionispora sp. 2/2-37]|uniref:hypothetical protein n=1 Tax=Propionispora sp. 2/2-37 TaxID=1677858 RepID=UPI0006BB75B3|nr:hypothetical protein [Propionispora sp. 2/2-37]
MAYLPEHELLAAGDQLRMTAGRPAGSGVYSGHVGRTAVVWQLLDYSLEKFPCGTCGMYQRMYSQGCRRSPANTTISSRVKC